MIKNIVWNTTRTLSAIQEGHRKHVFDYLAYIFIFIPVCPGVLKKWSGTSLGLPKHSWVQLWAKLWADPGLNPTHPCFALNLYIIQITLFYIQETFGGHGYKHILNTTVPKMISKGISQAIIDKILITNPANILTF